MIKKVEGKIERSKDYIVRHATKEGKPRAKLSKIQKTTLTRNKIELEYFSDYLSRLKHIQVAPKYLGEGIYTQRRRNAYKIDQNGNYGNLVIDLPKLYGQLKMIAYKDGKKIYDKQADFDTIDLLTKRFRNKKNTVIYLK